MGEDSYPLLSKGDVFDVGEMFLATFLDGG